MEKWKNYQKNFWKKYLFLEEKLIDTEKYVSFDKKNFKTYSNVFEELLVVICGEIEAVLKEWTVLEDGSIGTLLTELLGKKQGSFNRTIYLKLTTIKLKPFNKLYDLIQINKGGSNILKGFDASNHLYWWNSYNKIKHNKVKNKKKANLKNVLESLAALYILESLRIKDIYNEAVINNRTDKEIYDCPYKPSLLFDSDIETINFIDSSGNIAIIADEIDELFK